MERYRSGHNGPDSKSGSEKSLVGSNPTLSANTAKGRMTRPFFMFSFCYYVRFLLNENVWINFLLSIFRGGGAQIFDKVRAIFAVKNLIKNLR